MIGRKALQLIAPANLLARLTGIMQTRSGEAAQYRLFYEVLPSENLAP